MNEMIATMMPGRRSARSASTRSWNGVVNASSSAAWTLIQLLKAIVANIRSPSPLTVRVTGRMVGSLFLRAYERSERIYAAMQARGFEGELRYLPGSPLPPGALAWFGVLLVAIAAFVAFAHLWLPRL